MRLLWKKVPAAQLDLLDAKHDAASQPTFAATPTPTSDASQSPELAQRAPAAVVGLPLRLPVGLIDEDPNNPRTEFPDYGGYAALMGTIREPDLFRCAIDMLGPTDLIWSVESPLADYNLRRGSRPAFSRPRSSRRSCRSTAAMTGACRWSMEPRCEMRCRLPALRSNGSHSPARVMAFTTGRTASTTCSALSDSSASTSAHLRGDLRSTAESDVGPRSS